jgi:hypothetical protein
LLLHLAEVTMDSPELTKAKREFLEQVKVYCLNPTEEKCNEVVALGRVVEELRALEPLPTLEWILPKSVSQ